MTTNSIKTITEIGTASADTLIARNLGLAGPTYDTYDLTVFGLDHNDVLRGSAGPWNWNSYAIGSLEATATLTVRNNLLGG